MYFSEKAMFKEMQRRLNTRIGIRSIGARRGEEVKRCRGRVVNGYYKKKTPSSSIFRPVAREHPGSFNRAGVIFDREGIAVQDPTLEDEISKRLPNFPP
jgi:hypothetical protein